MILNFKEFLLEKNYPEGFEIFIDLAKKVKNPQEFINKTREIKNVDPEISDYFYNKYNTFSMLKAATLFIKDVEDGIYK